MFILMLTMVFIKNMSFAQEEENIKYVIKEYYKAIALGDLDTAMKYISKDYSDKDNQGRPVDYQRFKTRLEDMINQRQKNYVDYAINELEIEIISLEGSLAQAKVEYIWSGFNLNKLKEESAKRNLLIDLKKEDGVWRIIKFKLSSSN